MNAAFRKFKSLLPHVVYVGHLYFIRLNQGWVGFRVEGVSTGNSKSASGLLIQPFCRDEWVAHGDRLSVPIPGKVTLDKDGVGFKFSD